MTPPPTLGARARRFVLELPLDSSDGLGGVVRRYAAGPQLWGAIAMLKGEKSAAAPTGPEQAVTHRVTAAPTARASPPPCGSPCGLRRFRHHRQRPIRTGARRDLVCLVEEVSP